MRYLLSSTAQIFFAFIFISSCDVSVSNKHEVLSINQAPSEGVWSIALDSLPGGFERLYSLKEENSNDEKIILVCFDAQTKEREHYELQFGTNVEYKLLTPYPLRPRSFLVDIETSCSVLPPGDLLILENVYSRHIDSLFLYDGKYFSSNIQPLIRADEIVVPHVDLSYNMMDVYENELFFKNTSPLISIDSTLKNFRNLGSYPSDYREKAIYGYHLSPHISLHKTKGILMSFPGSKFVGLAIPENEPVFKEFTSAYHYDYRSLDTADIMEVSKAIQFQDTVSNYVQLGYSEEFDKIYRVYHRHEPMRLNGKEFYGSLLICDFEDGTVETEYLFRSGANYKYTRALPLEKGVLVVEYLSQSPLGPAIKFSMKDVFFSKP